MSNTSDPDEPKPVSDLAFRIGSMLILRIGIALLVLACSLCGALACRFYAVFINWARR